VGFRQIESQFHCVPLYIRDVLAIPFKEGKAGTLVYFPLSKIYIYIKDALYSRESPGSTLPYLLFAPPFSVLPFLRSPCSGSRESGVFEPTSVI
jgi:hypothetical protein